MGMLLFLWLFVDIESTMSWRVNLADHEVYRTRTFAVSERGVVAVIDRDKGHVLLLGSDGSAKARITQQGEGPGELQRPFELTWSRSDQAFLIIDVGNSRLSFWNEDGEFVKESAFSGRGLFVPRVWDEKQLFLARDVGAMSGTAQLVRVDRTNEAKQDIWTYEPPNRTFSAASVDESPITILFRWDPQLNYDVGSNFLAVSFGDEPVVRILGPDGEALQKPIRVKIPRYEVDDAQVEQQIQYLPTALHKSLRANVKKPKEGWPYFRALNVDPLDRIWVVGSSPRVGAPHPAVILSREGEVLGEMRLPSPPLNVSENAIYMLVDEDDEYFVHKISYVLD